MRSRGSRLGSQWRETGAYVGSYLNLSLTASRHKMEHRVIILEVGIRAGEAKKEKRERSERGSSWERGAGVDGEKKR